jgi:hypothetical protein
LLEVYVAFQHILPDQLAPAAYCRCTYLNSKDAFSKVTFCCCCAAAAEFAREHACQDCIAKSAYTKISTVEVFDIYFEAPQPSKMGKSKDKNRLGGRHCIKSAYDGQLGKKVTAGVRGVLALCSAAA